ncbi:MAG TPA: Stk1 family PASTA domain-containing Ser/Thr kinase [Gaiellales bacterium]|nr:Stk1 family PASTA domain-containing Ser/Thr kinase [Gaiellales bacterium]
MDSLIGELFDNRYRIERRIGTGGMADVFLARDETLGRRVAIKILAERYAQDDAFLERFRREATAAAGLSHPNIVSVYDRGQAAGTSYIAMEYLNGPTLKDEITSRAPLPEAEVVNWAVQALDALEFAHRQGVVHRDIKPHNMILTDEGRLKVTDFGIARAANVQQMTEVGSIVGTAQYLSPEQARGLDVGPQSDLYSMGIVLYEMLTGELPFTGESAVEIAMKQVSDPPPSIRKKNRLVSEGLEQVVMRSLSKDPALRHRSARQMADELRRVSRGGAPSSDTQMATRILTGGAAAVAAYTGAQTSVLEPAGAQPPPREQPPGPRRSALPWILVFILLLVSAAVGYVVYQQISGSGVTVPQLSGSCQHAKAQLAAVELKGTCQNKSSPADKLNQVVGSDPQSGSSADKNSTVTIFIGAGPKTAAVPDVSGKSSLEAQSILEGKGFKVDPTPIQVNSPKQPAGNVVSTVPKAGSVQPTGTVIKLEVATGLVVVPAVKGLSCDQATAKMKQKTLVATCQDQPDPNVPANQASGSQPAAGATAAQNSPVTVLISSGPQQVTVPPVTNMDKNDAIKALHDAGLKATITQQVECTDPTQNNIVSAQDPAAGAQVPQGTFVKITVLKFRPSDPSCVSPPPT